MECSALLDVYRVKRGYDEAKIKTGKALLLRIVEMLTKMCRRTAMDERDYDYDHDDDHHHERGRGSQPFATVSKPRWALRLCSS